MRRLRTSFLAAAVVFTFVFVSQALPGPAGPGGNPNPGILPPQARIAGFTYSEWSFVQWQRMFGELPQPKQLHFLPTVMLERESYWLTDTVPAGKAMFVLVLGFLGTPEDIMEDGLQILKDMARDGSMSCVVDGVPVEHLEDYVFGVPFAQGEYDKAVGCYLILSPPPPGLHFIRIVDDLGVFGGPTYNLAYDVTVAPGEK